MEWLIRLQAVQNRLCSRPNHSESTSFFPTKPSCRQRIPLRCKEKTLFFVYTMEVVWTFSSKWPIKDDFPLPQEPITQTLIFVLNSVTQNGHAELHDGEGGRYKLCVRSLSRWSALKRVHVLLMITRSSISKNHKMLSRTLVATWIINARSKKN